MNCFIAAPGMTDTTVLRSVLQELGVHPYDAYDFQQDTFVVDVVNRRMDEADFVIGVASGEHSNTYYEIGLAVGKGKPVLILVTEDEVPNYAFNHVNLRVDLTDRTLLFVTLKEFVSRVKSRLVPQVSIGDVTDIVPHDIEPYLTRIRTMRGEARSTDVESIIKNLLIDCGLTFEISDTSQERAVDFAVWADNLNQTVGNPIFIETKVGRIDEKMLRQAANQLRLAMSDSRARAGIVLYLDKEGHRFTSPNSLEPFVVLWDIEDFIFQVGKLGFARALLTRRKEIAHGVTS